jgi:hypothetical protein
MLEAATSHAIHTSTASCSSLWFPPPISSGKSQHHTSCSLSKIPKHHNHQQPPPNVSPRAWANLDRVRGVPFLLYMWKFDVLTWWKLVLDSGMSNFCGWLGHPQPPTWLLPTGCGGGGAEGRLWSLRDAPPPRGHPMYLFADPPLPELREGQGDRIARSLRCRGASWL